MLSFPPSSFFTPWSCFSFFPLAHSPLAPGHLLLHPLLSGQHGPRDEHLPAPTTRNGLKGSNINLSMDICGCGCVLGYLGMARSKKGLLGLHKASLGSNAHIGYFISYKCEIYISLSFLFFIFFFPTGILKIFHRGTTCFQVPTHHILYVQVSPNMPSINFIL